MNNRVTIAFDSLRGLLDRAAEIEFCVDKSERFSFCCMGLMSDEKTGEGIYWFGLTADGSYAFDFPTFEEFSSAKVFDGRSLFEVWDDVILISVNSCPPEDMIEMYLS